MTTTKSTTNAIKDLRIASLLPSTTDVCIALGLQNHVVGITHECDFPLPNEVKPFVECAVAIHNSNADHTATATTPTKPLTLTISHIDPHTSSQAEIDAAVKNSLHDGLSLYNLNDDSLIKAQPSIILTQSLCEVCAVAKDEVDSTVACKLPPNQCKVISLEPESLTEVAETFVTIAQACGVKERGEELKQLFWEGAERVKKITQKSTTRITTNHDDGTTTTLPKVLFMEWIDPPFNAGHWIVDMVAWSGCTTASSFVTNTCKSVQLSWQQIYDADPDLVVIACCGFDLKRNEKDAREARKRLEPLRAFREERIYAADGNLYFARPGPALREGMAILARCAYDGDVEVVDALEGLGWLPNEGEAWSKVVFEKRNEEIMEPCIPDVEDMFANGQQQDNYSKVHEEACLAGKDFYKDPTSGYNVFTEVAHRKRGKCCGSGCRHCPFDHVNVKDKTKNIQQPAFLYEGSDNDEPHIFASISSIPPGPIKVLFFSGGKDSFLTIRQLVKQRLQNNDQDPFHLILLTTFDSDTRIIAHQEVPIDTVLKQAKHLQLPLLAVPLRRGSGETYLSRIQKGLDAIHKRVPDSSTISLVFGDLHLDHIREWREKELQQYTLEYPLWKTPYDDLMNDLEASHIRVVLSAATKEGVKEGMLFSRELRKSCEILGMDGFGENGEFHSVAEVWSVSREEALGLVNGRGNIK